MDIFNDDYLFVSDFIEKKIPILRKNSDFNDIYIRLTDLMEELEKTLTENQKKKFDELVTLFYKTEKYYFALAYSFGVKYGEDLKK